METLSGSGIIGVGWSTSGGEAAALLNEKYLAADGIENVIRVLEEIEDERIGDLEFIELNACSGGCVGGVLCVENPYVAKARIQRLRKYLPVSQNHLGGGPVPPVHGVAGESGVRAGAHPVGRFRRKPCDDGGDRPDLREFPGLDCGACGAPSAGRFAEDVVRGTAKRQRLHLRPTGEDAADVQTPSSMGDGFGRFPRREVTRHGREETRNRR